MAAFDSTQTVPVLESGICACLASVDKRSDEVGICVNLKETALSDFSTAILTHPLLERIIVSFKLGYLLFLQRGATVTHDAAGASALFIVAAEVLREYL